MVVVLKSFLWDIRYMFGQVLAFIAINRTESYTKKVTQFNRRFGFLRGICVCRWIFVFRQLSFSVCNF